MLLTQGKLVRLQGACTDLRVVRRDGQSRQVCGGETVLQYLIVPSPPPETRTVPLGLLRKVAQVTKDV